MWFVTSWWWQRLLQHFGCNSKKVKHALSIQSPTVAFTRGKKSEKNKFVAMTVKELNHMAEDHVTTVMQSCSYRHSFRWGFQDLEKYWYARNVLGPALSCHEKSRAIWIVSSSFPSSLAVWFRIFLLFHSHSFSCSEHHLPTPSVHVSLPVLMFLLSPIKMQEPVHCFLPGFPA